MTNQMWRIAMDGDSDFSYAMEPLSEGEEAGAASEISVEQLQRLVRLLDNSDVSELELKRAEEGTRLVLRKVKASTSGGMSNSQDGLAPVISKAVAPLETKEQILAPLVGVFHAWAKPKGGSLVAVGDRVKPGQLVATIETLNVLNEVESPAAGHVVEILVQEGQAVEYGQALMTIDTSSGAEGA
jgi:acetyl-CoA carboxylase biotin carboxyl carrier protein